VLLAALATAEHALPLYSHRYSPKKFMQHQLFACLVLKSFLKTDYRGLVAHLADCPSLLEVLKLGAVPHYTTLHKASCRLLAAAPARRLLDATVREHMGRKRRVRRAAIDSTGLESSAASAYFVRRRVRAGMPWKTVVYHHFPKLGVVCDVETHFILASREERGPKPDVADFRPLLAAALARVGIDRVVADAGYDSEANHTFARQESRVRSIMPPKHGRPSTKPARGNYRRLMQTRFDLPHSRPNSVSARPRPAGIELITSDAHAGLKEARNACFSGVHWRRCQFHLVRNVLAHVPAKR
jgi:hypothetical protein